MKKIARAIAICVFYASASISLCFTQRFLTSIFKFKMASIILAAEQFANLILSTLILQYSDRKNNNQLTYGKQIYHSRALKYYHNLKNYCFQLVTEAKSTWILSLLYIFNALFGLKGIEYVSIPMYLALRRTLVFFVLIVTTLFGSYKIQNYSIIVAIFLITFGALVAAFNDLNASYIGYTYIIGHNLLTAIMLEYCNILAERRKVGILSYKTKNILNIFFFIKEIVQNNATNTLPILIIFCYLSGDFIKWGEFQQPHMNEFYFCFAVVAVLSFIHQYAQFFCSKENSSFAIGLTNNYKDIFSTSFGIILFHDLQLNKFIIFGFILSFLGAFLYTYLKIFEVNKPIENLPLEGDPESILQKEHQYIVYSYDPEAQKMA